ncbi:MAG: amino acid permease [Candidatus Eremiobacteraeota bacterium]|nr:amino acid permease [Candidatus Eremiobacteraeota bacterium]
MGRVSDENKTGPLAHWSLVAGGMVGGGIYTALGVVVGLAGQWAWLSLLLAGLVALPSAINYCRLSNHFQRSGGAFEFLRELKLEGPAGSLAWILLLGYVLTIALYAFAFGQYVAYAFHGGPAWTRGLALLAMVTLIVLNLGGVGKMKSLEIVTVSANLLVLLALAIYGLLHFQAVNLVAGIHPQPGWTALIGAASIFVSYEGFQLVAYEYEQIENPQKYLVPVVVSAVIFVIALYILVALGATNLAGALAVIEKKQVALSLAAYRGIGYPGLIALTVAAAMATSAAINSTLFSSAQLAARIAQEGELPAFFEQTNQRGVPGYAVLCLGGLATVLATTGSLSVLVETASLAFLVTFGVVNVIAYHELESHRWFPVMGISVGILVGLFLVLRLAISATVPLAMFLVTVALIFVGRPYVLQRVATDG